MNRLIALALLTLLFQLASAQEKQPAKPIASLEPFLGLWHAPDGVLKKNPHMRGRGIFKFEMDNKNSHLKIYEGFSLTNPADYDFFALLVPNPLTGPLRNLEKRKVLPKPSKKQV